MGAGTENLQGPLQSWFLVILHSQWLVKRYQRRMDLGAVISGQQMATILATVLEKKGCVWEGQRW